MSYAIEKMYVSKRHSKAWKIQSDVSPIYFFKRLAVNVQLYNPFLGLILYVCKETQQIYSQFKIEAGEGVVQIIVTWTISIFSVKLFVMIYLNKIFVYKEHQKKLITFQKAYQFTITSC